MTVDIQDTSRCIISTLELIIKSESLSPTLILWNDSPTSQADLLEYISFKRYHFIRFGIACNGSFILDEIYYHLTSEHFTLRNPILKMEAISKLIQNKKDCSVFIVTHFHLIKGDQISWLTGLIFEFDLSAKFIFIEDKDHFKRFQSANRYDNRINYFVSQIKLKYAIHN